tara:strand:+ start:616 stop:858 length:243 start_codon:yes stop_codon:yes gene_type:complete
MKVRISTKAVYHKVAEVEINIPDMENEKVLDYLLENENLYTDEIDEKLSEKEYDYGSGYEGGPHMVRKVYLDGKKFGGHL